MTTMLKKRGTAKLPLNPKDRNTDEIKRRDGLLKAALDTLLSREPPGARERFWNLSGYIGDSHGHYAAVVTCEDFSSMRRQEYILGAKRNLYGYLASVHLKAANLAQQRGAKLLLALYDEATNTRDGKFRFYVFEPKQVLEEGQENYRGTDDGRQIPMINFNIRLAVNLDQLQPVRENVAPATDPLYDFLAASEG